MTSPLAMQFVVREGHVGSTEAVAASVAVACLRFLDYAEDKALLQAAVHEWTSGQFRKIVRRAKNTKWDKALLSDLPHVQSTLFGVEVIAFQPVRLDHLPTELKRLQVSGHTTTGNSPASYVPSSLQIILNKDLHMSPGKAAAAAAHVAQLARERSNGPAWREAGYPLGVKTQTLPEHSDIVIRDAGFTEVEPGSHTAVGTLL